MIGIKNFLFTALVSAMAGATLPAAAFPVSMAVSGITGTDGTRVDGLVGTDLAPAGDALGSAVIAVGDYNRDGLPDLAVGAPAGGGRPGSVFVAMGWPGGLPYPLSLTGPGIMRFDGLVADDRFGTALAAGDVNGDGVTDLVVGAPGSGTVYVFFGEIVLSGAGLVSTATLSTTSAVRLQGAAAARTGQTVSVGDVNGDGIADILIGNGAAGAAAGYVVYGRAGGPTSTALSMLDGASGVVLGGAVAAQSSFTVSSVGDVNGDGIGDFVVGAPDISKAYLVRGTRSYLAAEVDVADPARSTAISGPAGSWFGFSTAGIDDINGDGLRDIAIGAPMASTTSTNNQAGKTFVVYGSAGNAPALDATALNGTNGGFQVLGASTGDRSGWSVASGGDMNLDGNGDLLIGAPYSSYSARAAGAAYAIFGRKGVFSNINLNGSLPNSLNGSNGFQIVGNAAGDLTGSSVSRAGDINRDGIGDIVIGASNTLLSRGSAFVLYGQVNKVADTTPPTISAARTPAANSYGWNNSAVTVSFSCADAQSGIVSCTPATVLGTQGANQSVTGTALDGAGNTASTTVGGISIDLSAPIVTVMGATDGAVYRKPPSVSCAATDALSGVVVLPKLTLLKGSTVNGLITYTATCSGATDRAANLAAPVSATFQVKKR